MRKINFYQDYENLSAKERAEFIYLNYPSYGYVIEEFKARLIYEIHSEEEYSRNQHKDELGVRIQKLGHYSDPTGKQAVDNVMLEESLDKDGELYISGQLSLDVVERLERKHYVLRTMEDEYKAFEKSLKALPVADKKILMPQINQSMTYKELAMELGLADITMRKKIAHLRKGFISYIANGFKAKL